MNSPTPTPLVLSDWAAERDYLLGTYLPQRSAIVMDEMGEYGFYPNTVAATFNQNGGYVPPGFDLTMSAPAGTIYYTLDGSDPRLVGGAINAASAIIYTPIDVSGDVTVKARVLDDGQWSAINEADFKTTAPGDFNKLRIAELQYHPTDFPGVVDDRDGEYIEILNSDFLPVSLNGVAIGGFANEPYAFDDGLILGAGECIVVARNPIAFQVIYGTQINLAPSGYSDRSLDNGGETVTLFGPQNQVIQSFRYDDSSPWPSAPDGDGQSLEIIDPLGNSSDPSNWRASLYFIGSPGSDGLPIPGDYDASGEVDSADYATWKLAFGAVVQPGNGADGNRDGRVDAADYTVWRDHLGDTTTLYGNAGGGSVAAWQLDSVSINPAETVAFTQVGVPLAPPTQRIRGEAANDVFAALAAPVDPVESNLLLAIRGWADVQPAYRRAIDGTRESLTDKPAPWSETVDRLFAEIQGNPTPGQFMLKNPLASRPLPGRI
jgi:hypothetical protein